MLFSYGGGGALVCDQPIPGITQELDTDSAAYYGGRYFVAESMHKEAACRLAILLGGVLLEMDFPPARQIAGATVDIRRELTWHALYGEHSRFPVCDDREG